MARHLILTAAVFCALVFSGVFLGQDKVSTPTPTPTTTPAPTPTPTSTPIPPVTTPPPTGDVSIAGDAVVKIDTLCGAKGQGTGRILVNNKGASEASLSPIAGDIMSKTPVKTLTNARLTFSGAPIKLPGKTTAEITAEASGVFDDGEFTSSVQSGGANIGNVRIVRASLPFGISLDATNPDAPELTFTNGEGANFRLKNADSRSYILAWEYTVDGITVRSSDPAPIPKANKRSWPCSWLCKDDSVQGQATNPQDMSIMAGGQQAFSLNAPEDWFPRGLTGLFKEKISDGYLTVYRVDAGCQDKSSANTDKAGDTAKTANTDRTAVKTFKIKTHLLSSAPGIRKELFGDIVVFLFLAAGGIMSLLLNFALPNQTRRLKIEQLLDALGEKVGNLSWALASRLRVLAGLQYRLIHDQLRSTTGIDSDFATEMQGMEQDMAQLSKRLAFLGALWDVRVNLEKSRAGEMPPGTMFALEEKFGEAVEIGKKTSPTDAELQSGQALIKQIQDILDAGVQVTDAAIDDMVKRTKEFKVLFDPANGALGKTDTSKDVRAKLPGPFTELAATQEDTWKANPPTKDMFVALDRMLFKLRLLAEYIRLVEGLAADNPLRTARAAKQPDLIRLAGQNSWNAIYDADRLLCEMEGGIFAEDVGKELQAKNVRIDRDPQIVHPHRPVQFTLKFLKSAFNDAPACKEWTCRWTFCHQDEDDLTEEGWSVTHYFQQAQKPADSRSKAQKPAVPMPLVQYSVKVEVTRDLTGEVVAMGNVAGLPNGTISVIGLPRRSWGRLAGKIMTFHWKEAGKEWHKSKIGAGRMLDFLRLMLALVIALLGLLAGAKEQLLKLDVLPALVAIFLLGFGADQVKNLFTQKPAGTDTGAQH